MAKHISTGQAGLQALAAQIVSMCSIKDLELSERKRECANKRRSNNFAVKTKY